MTAPVLEIHDVSKAFGGLRPLRIECLAVSANERVAIHGLDQPMAEVFINLVTGATLPDRGEVRVFGQCTTRVADSAEWLALVDRFGIVSDRAVLLEACTPLQNLALPFTLDIEPVSDAARPRAQSLAHEAGLDPAEWDRPVSALDTAARARVRFGRALALDPAVLLLEHPSSAVPREQVTLLGEHMRNVARSRAAAIVALTMDSVFANAVADRLFTLDAATGRLKESRRGWGFLRRLG